MRYDEYVAVHLPHGCGRFRVIFHVIQTRALLVTANVHFLFFEIKVRPGIDNYKYSYNLINYI